MTDMNGADSSSNRFPRFAHPVFPTMVRTLGAFALIAVNGILCGTSHAADLRSGSQYTIVGQLYLSGVYRNLNNRQLKKPLAFGSLTAIQFSGPEVAFQSIVPKGTIMTVIGPAPKRMPLPSYADRYFVRLNPDLSRGLDIIVELNRGMDGKLDGLNPDLFGRP